MSSRPILSPFQVITDGSMAASITSAPTIIQNVSMVSYDISWTGTAPVGVMSVEVSNTYSQNVDGSVRNAGSWTALTLSSAPAVSGSTGSGFIDLEALSAFAVRLVYTRTSGVGTMNATISGKVQ